MFIIASIGIVIVVIEYIIKYLVLQLPAYQSLPLIKGILYITPAYNTGAAFGLLQGYNKYLLIISIILVFLFIIYSSKKNNLNTLEKYSMGLILGGACSNILDRIIHGYVIDYLDIKIWPIFNLADSCISLGIALIIISSLLKYERSRKKNSC